MEIKHSIGKVDDCKLCHLSSSPGGKHQKMSRSSCGGLLVDKPQGLAVFPPLFSVLLFSIVSLYCGPSSLKVALVAHLNATSPQPCDTLFISQFRVSRSGLHTPRAF